MSAFNILFVGRIPFNPSLGGVERVSDILAKEFIRRGHRVFYLCEVVPDTEMLRYVFPAPLTVLSEGGGFNNTVNISAYKDFLLENNIDLVINQQGWAPCMNRVLSLARTISVIHTSEDGLVKMDMSYSRMLRREKTIVGFIRWLIKIVLYPIYIQYKSVTLNHGLKRHYRLLAQGSNAVVFLSPKDSAAYQRRISPVKANVYDIPNPSIMVQDSFSLIKKEKIILYVGRLEATIKKPLRLLMVWKVLQQTHSDWKLVFVGDGDQVPAMKEYVKKNKLSNVSFEGHQINLTDYYRKASFICLTSEVEGFGMSLLEGMGFGCIPVTFNNYGASEILIENWHDGILVPAYNLKKYAKCLDILMNNDSERKRLSYNAYLKAKTFSISSIADKWETLFKITMK